MAIIRTRTIIIIIKIIEGFYTFIKVLSEFSTQIPGFGSLQ